MPKGDYKSEFLLKVTLQTVFVGYLFYAILYSAISIEILYPAIITVAGVLLIDAILYLLYLRGFNTIVKHSLLLLLSVSMSALVFFILGPKPGLHYFFLAFMLLPLMLLSFRNVLAWVLYVIINLFLFIWAEIYLEEFAHQFHIPENIILPFRVITIVSTVILICVSQWVIYVANKRSELALTEKADEIESQLKLVEKQQIMLKEANATKDKFFSIIAHDLKNPSYNMLGFAELLSGKFHELDQEKQKLYADMILEASGSINELIQNLLLWSRTQRGKIEAKPEPFTVKALYDKNIKLQKLAADQKSVVLENSCPEELKAYGDLQMMDTVVRNLLSNAIKFTPKGGIIILSGQQNGGNVILEIQDTGVGMDEEEISKLFQIDQSFSKKGTDGEKGSGLGLIIVQEFMIKNNGRIKVESEPGSGSRFALILPGQ